jgi:hypothetical protein
MTDDELFRLAKLLQRMRGEGLAFINPGEAEMLKDAGGSGEPIQGTQGFGVGGGPIRSYEEVTDDKQFEGVITTENPDTSEKNWGGGEGGTATDKLNDDGTITPINQTNTSTTTTTPSEDQGETSTQRTAPPPEYGPDLDGNMHSSQAGLDAANRAIRLRKAREAITKQAPNFQTDTDFATWYAENAGTLGLDDSYKEDLEQAFNDQMLTVYKESRLQTKNFSDLVSKALRSKGVDAEGNPIPLTQGDLQNLTYDAVSANLTGYFGADEIDRLSENTKRSLFESMLKTAVREARFTLTPEEVDVFARTAISAATVNDATTPTVGEITEADQVTVGEVDKPDRVVIGEIGELNRTLIDDVVDGETELSEHILQRVRGEATSPAELQLKRATENNLKMLLGATAGVADPAKLRQLRNTYSETAQVLSGQAAELRSREQIDAEGRLVQIYKQQGDRELQVAMTNLETKKQEAFEQADLDQVRNLSIQQANLQRVITKANLDRDVELSNLDTRRQKALAQGRIDVAVALANLQKDITLSQTNAELALRSRALDDALALANYQGEMALEGIEVKIDLAEMELDVKTKLAELGYDTQEKIATLNADTQLAIANLNASASKYAADSKERAGFIGAIGTIIAAIAA